MCTTGTVRRMQHGGMRSVASAAAAAASAPSWFSTQLRGARGLFVVFYRGSCTKCRRWYTGATREWCRGVAAAGVKVVGVDVGPQSHAVAEPWQGSFPLVRDAGYTIAEEARGNPKYLPDLHVPRSGEEVKGMGCTAHVPSILVLKASVQEGLPPVAIYRWSLPWGREAEVDTWGNVQTVWTEVAEAFYDGESDSPHPALQRRPKPANAAKDASGGKRRGSWERLRRCLCCVGAAADADAARSPTARAPPQQAVQRGLRFPPSAADTNQISNPAPAPAPAPARNHQQNTGVLYSVA